MNLVREEFDKVVKDLGDWREADNDLGKKDYLEKHVKLETTMDQTYLG